MGNAPSKKKERKLLVEKLHHKQPFYNEDDIICIHDSWIAPPLPSSSSASSSSISSSPKTIFNKPIHNLFSRNLLKKSSQRKSASSVINTSYIDTVTHSTISTFANEDDVNNTFYESPMVKTVTRLSAQYDQKKTTSQFELLLSSSCAPCIVSQPLRRMTYLHSSSSSNSNSNNNSSSNSNNYNNNSSSSSSGRSNSSSSISSRSNSSSSISSSNNNMTVTKNSMLYHSNNHSLTSVSTITATDDNDDNDSVVSIKKKNQRKPVTGQEMRLELFLNPNAEELRRIEKDRQQRLHYVLKYISKGKIHQAKLESPSVIVNWCCGIGTWCMEMATMFPNTRIIGVDYKEVITSFNMQHSLPNLKFKYIAAHDKLTGLESFEDNSVDFVMMRDVWLINIPILKWEYVLKQVYRILKPGGWIELQEHTTQIGTMGPCGAKLFQWYTRFFTETQIDRTIARKLGDFLGYAGFSNIDQQTTISPVGEWCTTLELKESGFLFKDILERHLRVLSRWVAQVCDVDEGLINQLLTKVVEDEADEHNTSVDWIFYTARKPAKNR
ncbi:S-adenosyl-L-methionine-dependent methyltransferase [Cokeromyces recurvatus]|uniref:S-adenosyl-L-methionine-dependent methyltransferase n=1 Tax=Cokeromyces recurvatus TaxID=90255 RepID=UPI00221F6637|nr:S-adenosyl-L-methionine-dependent methyltransferase [Cokeromyces recurvatus]KAI7906888.1 S-adenosyl-L-methionine-dependent methyltransferase [Cokeromyces recurvatus]